MDPLDLLFGAIVLVLALVPLAFRADLGNLGLSAGLVALGAGLRIVSPYPLAMGVALGPLAIYLLAIGTINLARRPVVVSGTRDTAALGLAALGVVMIGPAELLVPLTASIRLGGFVWVLLVCVYMLGLVLVLLMLRPRLVIYNISIEELRPVLAEVVRDLDPEARWAQDSLALPRLGVQLHLEALALWRNVSLVSSGPLQNPQGWRRLELALAAALARLEVPRNLRAVGLVSAGLMILAVLVLTVSRDPQAVAQMVFDALRL